MQLLSLDHRGKLLKTFKGQSSKAKAPSVSTQAPTGWTSHPAEQNPSPCPPTRGHCPLQRPLIGEPGPGLLHKLPLLSGPKAAKLFFFFSSKSGSPKQSDSRMLPSCTCQI
eukprot:scaffold181785_cov21-Tisochrysis_lutea.AAC.1